MDLTDKLYKDTRLKKNVRNSCMFEYLNGRYAINFKSDREGLRLIKVNNILKNDVLCFSIPHHMSSI